MLNVLNGTEVICSNKSVYGFRFTVENCVSYEDVTEILGVDYLGEDVRFIVSNDVVYDQEENLYTNGNETIELLI